MLAASFANRPLYLLTVTMPQQAYQCSHKRVWVRLGMIVGCLCLTANVIVCREQGSNDALHLFSTWRALRFWYGLTLLRAKNPVFDGLAKAHAVRAGERAAQGFEYHT